MSGLPSDELVVVVVMVVVVGDCLDHFKAAAGPLLRWSSSHCCLRDRVLSFMADLLVLFGRGSAICPWGMVPAWVYGRRGLLR